MTALNTLFTQALQEPGLNLHYKSPDFDLSFISFEKKIYFVLNKENEACLSGSAFNHGGKLIYDFDIENSSWLKNNISIEKAFFLLNDKLAFMQATKPKKVRP